MKTRKLNAKHTEDQNCFIEFIKKFDFYKDLPESLSEPTITGAWVSLILLAIVGLLLSQTVYNFISLQKTSEIMIDVNSGDEKLHINLDITLEKAPCSILSLDIVDVTGVHVVDIEGKLHKYRLDSKGNNIGMLPHIDDDGHVDSESAKNINDDDYQKSVKA
jgi:hypothetical protein